MCALDAVGFSSCWWAVARRVFSAHRRRTLNTLKGPRTFSLSVCSNWWTCLQEDFLAQQCLIDTVPSTEDAGWLSRIRLITEGLLWHVRLCLKITEFLWLLEGFGSHIIRGCDLFVLCWGLPSSHSQIILNVGIHLVILRVHSSCCKCVVFRLCVPVTQRQHLLIETSLSGF